MPKAAKQKKFTAPGLILTVLVTVALLWAAPKSYKLYFHKTPPTTAQKKKNELKAFENLQLIVNAQKQYKLADFDRDHRKNYARFLTHLWTSVDDHNEPVLLSLLPRKLAFAVGPPRAIDGYYFANLHSRQTSPPQQQRRLDYQKEWAAAAIPKVINQTGLLIFITDNSGDIFASSSGRIPPHYPHDPAANKWTKIDSTQILTKFQKTLQYNDK